MMIVDDNACAALFWASQALADKREARHTGKCESFLSVDQLKTPADNCKLFNRV
jgi:hypothetical protein